jgi:hypothetical protein
MAEKKHYVTKDPLRWEGIASPYESAYKDLTRQKPTKKVIRQKDKDKKLSRILGKWRAKRASQKGLRGAKRGGKIMQGYKAGGKV